MNPKAFDHFKNENLTRPLIVLKRIGQAGFIVTGIGIVILQFNDGKVGGTPFLDIVSSIMAISALVGLVCFMILGLVVLGKTKQNNPIQAIGQSMSKIFLYIYLPAIIIAAILFFFVMPNYQ